MVKIGIDCRVLVGEQAGIARYLYEVLRGFADSDVDAMFYLYAPSDIHVPECCRLDDRFVFKIGAVYGGVAWLHTILPFWLWRDRIDVFWGPCYALPLVRIARYRTIITIHDLTYLRFPRTMRWATYLHNRYGVPVYSKLAQTILTDSHCARNELCTLMKVPNHKVKAIHLGVREHSLGQSELSIIQGSYILSVGTMEPRKNIERLIEAYAMLPTRVREAYPLVISGGNGWRGVDPEHLIRKYSISETAVFLGRVNDEQLFNLYRHATVFVFPSMYEGFGLPLLEAMLCGAPILCSFESAMREITNGAALYCDVLSPEDMHTKLQMLLEEPALREALSHRGKRHAKQFDWSTTAGATLEQLVGGQHQ